DQRFTTNEPFIVGSPPYQGGVRGGFETARTQPPPCPLLGKEGVPADPASDAYGSQLLEDSGRRQLPAMDAIGDPDTAVGAAGEGQPGMTREQLVDPFHALEVADTVLRHRLRMAMNPCQHRLAADPEQCFELAPHAGGHGGIV